MASSSKSRLLFLAKLLFCLLPLLLSACSQITYYRQSIQGHWQVLEARQDIDTLLASSETASPLKSRLRTATAILQFAHRDLLLPDNGSYKQYADIGRDYIVWNVIAAPELSTQAKTWCYAFVGCLPYRGYYSEQKAESYATQLQREGFETFTGGVNAYSTLGWFHDPILNTMLKSDDNYLAELIFHELSHQKFYVRDDANFNEALADAIARIGVIRWLEQKGENSKLYLEDLKYEDAISEILLKYQQQLQMIYRSSQADSLKRLNKAESFQLMQQEINIFVKKHPDAASLAAAYLKNLNNAKLSIISTYRRWVPVLMALYRKLEHNLNEFYHQIELLCRMEKKERYLYLNTMNE